MSFLNLITNASKLKNVLFCVIRYGCITYCFSEYVADVAICKGPSMEPTINSKDIVITELLSAKFHKFHYGDIVVSKLINNPKELVCKRITGLPGDKIRSRRNELVPAGHVWLEGDNRDNSEDSRFYGPVPQGLIRGRIICRIWPIKDITMLTVKSR